MRAVHLTDLDIAARVLAGLPAPERSAAARRMVAEAQAADLFRKRTGRKHERWGCGSLQDAARSHGTPDPLDARSATYRAALADILSAVAGAAPHQDL